MATKKLGKKASKDVLEGAARALKRAEVQLLRFDPLKADAGNGTSTSARDPVWSWRRKRLPLARTLVEAAQLERRDVARIEAGTGASDGARDIQELAALLGPHKRMVELVHGRGALDDAKAASVGALAALSASTGKSATSRAAAELRDRYATLAVQRHDRPRAAVAAVAGYREAALLLPPLADGARAEKKPAPAATLATPG
ncbi:MAG: hypothetical protein HY906_16995 [Deltaproteobacteria bacterium]|nr:hypothetical protein [Deltaproteobacteria bacterium]